MSMSIDGSTVMNVCCHSNGYSSAAIVLMHVLSVLYTRNNRHPLYVTANHAANVSHHILANKTTMTAYLLQIMDKTT